MFYNPPHRSKSAPMLGAEGPGQVGPFGPWGSDEDQPKAEPEQEDDAA